MARLILIAVSLILAASEFVYGPTNRSTDTGHIAECLAYAFSPVAAGWLAALGAAGLQRLGGAMLDRSQFSTIWTSVWGTTLAGLAAYHMVTVHLAG